MNMTRDELTALEQELCRRYNVAAVDLAEGLYNRDTDDPDEYGWDAIPGEWLSAPEDDLTPEEKEWLEKMQKARLKEIEDEEEKERWLRDQEER